MTRTHSPRFTSSPPRGVAAALLSLSIALVAGCAKTPEWGMEHVLMMPGKSRQVWAVAPAVNLSGHREVDPLLQSDILYQQLQEVRGLTVIPVDRVVAAYAGLKVEKVQTPEQAALVCDLLGCDALIVPSITAYDAYDPPKFGGALQLFKRSSDYARPPQIDVRELARAASPGPNVSLPPPRRTGFVQAVGVYDATNGTVRDSLWGYAAGREDPVGPMGKREYLLSMDRYVGFAYHSLIEDLLRETDRSSRRPTG